MDGKPLKSSELIKLNFAKNDDGEYVDPVTYKAFTDNTHIVALKNTGNVFAWDTIERLNIKVKNWKDLVSDDDFTRQDIITLQDPQNLGSRDLSTFKYIQDGTSTLTEEQQRERDDPTSGLNTSAMGSSAKIVKAKQAVAKARAERASLADAGKLVSGKAMTADGRQIARASANASTQAPRSVPYNAATHTTGRAAASFTSTGVTPHTSNERALLSEEEYMLKPRRIKEKGYARIQTSHGDINIELIPEHAPRAVWNFVHLAKKGYYDNVKFHRNIPSFMIQGGDPTGTGKGGQSVWGKPFADEFAQSPLTHSDRGILSMANKGKNTNTSQFFITYRKTPHLDRKHTIFGKCIITDPGGETEATLKKLEKVETGDGNRPVEPCSIENIKVFIDPFEEFRKNKERETANGNKPSHVEDDEREDDTTTWTGKRVRNATIASASAPSAGVGKYMASASDTPLQDDQPSPDCDDAVPEELEERHSKKRKKASGFGNFDAW